MKQLITRSYSIAGLLVALTIAAFAQSSYALRVHVPFQFVLGQTSMPAGDYVIQQDLPSGIVTFQIRGLHGSAAALSINDGSPLGAQTPELVFQRRGSNVFLTQIHLDDNSSRLFIPASR